MDADHQHSSDQNKVPLEQCRLTQTDRRQSQTFWLSSWQKRLNRLLIATPELSIQALTTVLSAAQGHPHRAAHHRLGLNYINMTVPTILSVRRGPQPQSITQPPHLACWPSTDLRLLLSTSCLTKLWLSSNHSMSKTSNHDRSECFENDRSSGCTT